MVEKIWAGQGLQPHDFSQVALVSQAYWGWAVTQLFGFSFTSLVVATLTLSLLGALSFYLLLRRMGFDPAHSGLGVGLLVVNPMYLTYSYSFMTDVNFLALLLLSCLFYFEGLRNLQGIVASQQADEVDTRVIGITDRTTYIWLGLGSLFAALAFLTRQFGFVAALVALLWLLYARKFNLPRFIAVMLLPTLAVIGFTVWRMSYPPHIY